MRQTKNHLGSPICRQRFRLHGNFGFELKIGFPHIVYQSPKMPGKPVPSSSEPIHRRFREGGRTRDTEVLDDLDHGRWTIRHRRQQSREAIFGDNKETIDSTSPTHCITATASNISNECSSQVFAVPSFWQPHHRQ
jgi:hypothetical protein